MLFFVCVWWRFLHGMYFHAGPPAGPAGGKLWQPHCEPGMMGVAILTQMLHGAGRFTHICPKNHPNVGKLYQHHGAYGFLVQVKNNVTYPETRDSHRSPFSHQFPVLRPFIFTWTYDVWAEKVGEDQDNSCTKFSEPKTAEDWGNCSTHKFHWGFRESHVASRTQTWRWKIPLWMEIFIGKSPVNGSFSSKPCLITGG